MLYKFAMSLIVMSVYMANGEEAAAEASNSPSVSPSTNKPSASPSSKPSASPSSSPSASPSLKPTRSPLAEGKTHSPTPSPSDNPSASPSMQPSSDPTAEPTMEPSMTPTTTISVYQNEVTVTQPCCGNASIPRLENDTLSESVWQCNAGKKGTYACSREFYFYGSDNLMVSDGTVSIDGEFCDCTFTLNQFEFEIPESDAEANETVYDQIEGNWPKVSSEFEANWGEDAQSAVEAAAAADKYECHRLLVTECSESAECMEDTKPAMKDGETQVAQTKLSQMWRDYLPRAQQTEDMTYNNGSTCFCLWLYDNCPEDTTTSTSTASPEGETPTENEDETDGDNDSGASSLYMRSVIVMLGLSFLSIL